ncbi:MAG: hypothetical protein ACKV19_06920 [Verrucomicrobiales bacterium]
MIIRSISIVTFWVPVLALGVSSCSSMQATRTRLAAWQEKREAQRMEREIAEADKQLAEEAKESGAPKAPGMEDSIFLDYANPSGSLLEGALAANGSGGGVAGGDVTFPGGELPTLPDWSVSGESGEESSGPIFLDASASGTEEGVAGGPILDPELVRAWAASISPVMGASLTEPLITAAMTARLNPTESAVAAHAAATDTQRLADAFVGQPTRARTPGSTSELEHE